MDFYDIGKRIMDIIGAILGIILFFPFMAVSAIFIKIVSPEGPIFADIPNRVGKGGKEFKMFKFRSMIPNAHELMLNDPKLRKLHRESGYKLDPDPRLIRGGKIIRKTSIDEMPQFFNVLVGSMSIVGPRAYFAHELEEQAERFPEARKYIEQMKTVKPGITGPWQVGGRSEIGFKERVKMDADYASRRSLLYDLLIVLKTPFAVISGKGVV